MKKIFAIICSSILFFYTALPIFATKTDDGIKKPPRLVDNAKLLTDSEEQDLLKMLDDISTAQKCDVVVLTVRSLGYNSKSPTDYADDFFDYKGYGYGDEYDGILLLINMKERDWVISTTGYGITAFTDVGQKYIVSKFKKDLSKGNYANAFTTYAQLCDDFLTQAKVDTPYDVGNLPIDPLTFRWVVISFLIGAFISFLLISHFKSKLKSVKPQLTANNYVRDHSFKLHKNHEVFLYSDLSVIERDIHGTLSSGGSSTHKGSSGRTHGGSFGKF